MEARSTASARRLLDATLEITRGVGLAEVLHRLMRAARRLVAAEYAAVGIVSQGHLVRFVHSGLDTDTVTRIAHPPEGKGVLGQLIDEPRALRLADLATHPASVGFPAHHPPMHSFLGVPITTRAGMFGNLYLTEKRGGTEFSVEDQELAVALASAAAVAIDNAELFRQAQRRQAWQNATTDVTTLLLSVPDPQAILAVMAEHAMRLGDAAAAMIILPAEDPVMLRVGAGAGLLASGLVGEYFLAELARGAISPLLPTGGNPVVVDDVAAYSSTPSFGVLGMGPVVAVPLGAGRADGALLVARTREEPGFAPPDVTMIASFAERAGSALGLAEDRRKRELEHLVEDRERIAAHLSEHTMQALLGISTTVHGLTARMQSAADAHRLTEQADRLDAVLREMQRAIFGLRPA
ncbi:MAG TPA: GAF domain-containing protein [Pseudonocardiaceae bacterium]